MKSNEEESGQNEKAESTITAERPAFWKRKWLIRPKLQIAFAVAVVWVIWVTVGVTFLAVYYSLASLIMEPSPQMRLSEGLEIANKALIWQIPGIAVVLSLIAFLMTVLFMHRLVGPIHRIEQVLFDAKKGNFPDSINLRENDEFKSTADVLLQVLNGVRDRDLKSPNAGRPKRKRKK